ncbi:IL15 protein, partial [Chaetorhynchus papuensis]|nr:IL15 protein [Chaetorhynchus papuensis]
MMCKVLIFGCIAAVILMTAAYRVPLTTELPPAQQEERLRASISDLEQLKNIENNFLDFYTPNDKQECNRATLKCYLKELKVLKKDVEEENRRHIINIEKNLDYFKVGNLLQVSNYSNPACKKCESNEKKLFPEFRQELKTFLQSLLR